MAPELLSAVALPLLVAALAAHLVFRWRRWRQPRRLPLPLLREARRCTEHRQEAAAPVVVVTGGCGLLGRWVVHALVRAPEGFLVRVLDVQTLER